MCTLSPGLQYDFGSFLRNASSCGLERKFTELDQNTSAKERERIRIDFWDWIVQSHGIPTLNDDEIEMIIIKIINRIFYYNSGIRVMPHIQNRQGSN